MKRTKNTIVEIALPDGSYLNIEEAIMGFSIAREGRKVQTNF